MHGQLTLTDPDGGRLAEPLNWCGRLSVEVLDLSGAGQPRLSTARPNTFSAAFIQAS